jgi:hypothetical protein
MKLVTNISMLEESLTSFDYDSILFRTWVELDVNPTQIMSTERRVQAKRSQSRSISLGLKYMKAGERNPNIKYDSPRKIRFHNWGPPGVYAQN